MLFGFSAEDFLPFLIFAIPIVAIVGGITLGIVKTMGQQRIVELAQRERIAALERGVDISKLSPLPVIPGDEELGSPFNPLRRYHGLIVGGLVCVAAGVGVGIFLYNIEGSDRVWAVGFIPGLVGVALLASAMFIRPRGGRSGT